jgi:peptide-methionine (S)-S-oxide reductase
MRVCALLAIFASILSGANVPPPAVDLPSGGDGRVATAVLAVGRFWGMEAVFEKLKGVIGISAGYARGKAEDAQAAESVQILYDPNQISHGKLPQVFFAVAHDPTQIDREGPDAGPQFRSVIFYSTDVQKQVDQAYSKQTEHARVFQAPMEMQVTLLPGFFATEDHNQHDVKRNPNDPYLAEDIAPKLKALEEQFPDLLKP